MSVVCGYIYWAGLPIVKKKKKNNDKQNGDNAHMDSKESQRLSQESFESIIDGFAQGKRPKASKLRKLKS